MGRAPDADIVVELIEVDVGERPPGHPPTGARLLVEGGRRGAHRLSAGLSVRVGHTWDRIDGATEWTLDQLQSGYSHLARMTSTDPPSVLHDSLVRRLVWHEAPEVLEALESRAAVRDGPLQLLRPEAPHFVWSTQLPGHRLPCRLLVPFSARLYRVDLSIETWTLGRTAISLRLPSRSTRHCPPRYYRAAHRVLDRIAGRLG